MKGTSGAGVSAIQTRLQASTQFWSVDSSSVIRDSACMIAMADARSGMFFGTKGSCPRRRSRLNGGWRVPAKGSNWPSAVSCNRHTQLEPRKAAIGSTRPTADGHISPKRSFKRRHCLPRDGLMTTPRCTHWTPCKSARRDAVSWIARHFLIARAYKGRFGLKIHPSRAAGRPRGAAGRPSA
jgi:hypothetical protein